MKVLIQTLGSAGDTYPFIGIGRTLKERGHDVVVFANEIFASAVTDAGLEFVEMGDSEAYSELAGRPEVWDRRRGIELILTGVSEHLEESIEIIEGELDGADVLVNSSLGFGARMVRDIHGIPLVTAHLAPSLLRSSIRLPLTEIMWVRDHYPAWLKTLWWRVGDFLVDRLVTPELDLVRDARGLPRVRRVLEEWAVYSPDATLGLFPSWFGPPQADWAHPVELVGFPLYVDREGMDLSADLTSWLDRGDPPIVFTAGSANLHARTFFETARQVCRRQGARGLLVTSNHSDVPSDLGCDIRHESYIPFAQLLSRSSALVSHGGVGTTAQALAAGLPHLVTHVNFDQRDNASRLEDLGAGLGISMRRFKEDSALEAVKEVLRPEVAARAVELSKRIERGQSLRMAADAIERSARG